MEASRLQSELLDFPFVFVKVLLLKSSSVPLFKWVIEKKFLSELSYRVQKAAIQTFFLWLICVLFVSVLQCLNVSGSGSHTKQHVKAFSLLHNVDISKWWRQHDWVPPQDVFFLFSWVISKAVVKQFGWKHTWCFAFVIFKTLWFGINL